MIIAGIDYSMTSPSICIFVGEERDAFCFSKCTFHFLTDTDKYATYFLKTYMEQDLISGRMTHNDLNQSQTGGLKRFVFVIRLH